MVFEITEISRPCHVRTVKRVLLPTPPRSPIVCLGPLISSRAALCRFEIRDSDSFTKIVRFRKCSIKERKTTKAEYKAFTPLRRIRRVTYGVDQADLCDKRSPRHPTLNRDDPREETSHAGAVAAIIPPVLKSEKECNDVAKLDHATP
jgi:hypothetical protein